MAIEEILTYAGHPLVLIAAGFLGGLILYLLWLEDAIFAGCRFLLTKALPAADARRLLDKEIWLIRLLLLLGVVSLVLEFLPTASAKLAAELVLKSLLLLFLFMALIKAVDPAIASLAKRAERRGKQKMPPAISYFLSRGVVALLVFVLATLMLDLWGVNVTALLGGLGLMGMAAALAAKDSLENIFSGLTIIGSGIFRVGDWIKAGKGVEGTVEFIGLRITHIRSFDDSLQFVPNSRLVNEEVQNFGKMRRRRIKLRIGLTYDTNAAQMLKIRSRIKAHLQKDKDIDQKGVCLVDFTSYGDSAIILDLYYFTAATGWAYWREVRNRHIISFKKIVEEEGSGFAFPTSTVHLVQNSPEKI